LEIAFKYPTRIDFASRSSSFAAHTLGPKSRSRRLLIISLGLVLWTAVLFARLYSLQIKDFETWQDWALKEHFKEIVVASERGPIFDRNGKLMAVSVPAGSVYVRPQQIKDKNQTAKDLAALLDLDSAYVKSKLVSSEPFVWISRQIPRAQAEKVSSLNDPAIGYIMESKRYYPFNQASSALIGLVGLDGNGLSGLERRFESVLHTDHVKTRVARDAYGNMIDINPDQSDNFRVPKGASIKLTIDSSLQMIVDEELESGKQSAGAKAAMAVMLDSDTGEILAMSQSPGLNFNSATKVSKQDLKNLAVETVFEPGSIMKPIIAASALEKGVVTPNDMINCESGHFFYASHNIKDVHPSGIIPFRDVVIRSSNIGMTKVGTRLGADALYSALRNFGFGALDGLKLPGQTPGILRPLREWAKIDVATHSFGQGVAVTPLQMVRAFGALANGGKLPELKIINDDKSFRLRRVISEKTSNQIRDMLYGVVEDEHGTGKLARIDGIRIGGKTGTAQKASDHGKGYAAGAYMASFVGFADASELGLSKKLALIVVVDEPHAGSIYGGAVAAPIFKRIMQRSVYLLTTQNQLSSPSERGKVQRQLVESESPDLQLKAATM